MDSEKMKLIINLETPDNATEEDYINIHNKIKGAMLLLDSNAQVNTRRKCDGEDCGKTINFMSKNCSFKCNRMIYGNHLDELIKCNISYDLCQACQTIRDENGCPWGYGCNTTEGRRFVVLKQKRKDVDDLKFDLDTPLITQKRFARITLKSDN